jgi:hypothetical protein
MQIQLLNNGVPALTGSQSKSNFTSADFELVRGFLVGDGMRNFVKLMGWIADGTIVYGATQTVTISNL